MEEEILEEESQIIFERSETEYSEKSLNYFPGKEQKIQKSLKSNRKSSLTLKTLSNKSESILSRSKSLKSNLSLLNNTENLQKIELEKKEKLEVPNFELSKETQIKTKKKNNFCK